jgi:hypothetical protein
MRKHRLSGVAILTLLGVGAAAQRPLLNSHPPHPNDTSTAYHPLPPSTLTAAVRLADDASGIKPQDFFLVDSGSLGDAGGAGGHPITAHPPIPREAELLAAVVPQPPKPTPAAPAPSSPPAAASPPVLTPPPPPATSSSATPADWAALRMCESGDNYSIDTGNGYYGAYQFSLATWQGLGYGGLPSAASPAVQDAAAQTLYDAAGWSPWPVCSVELGLR